VDFDPSVISYGKLLDVFWASHDPLERPWRRQYMSAIFPHDDEQKNLAIRTRSREAARRNGKIHTEILPASRFYLAEAYHQKYALRGSWRISCVRPKKRRGEASGRHVRRDDAPARMA